MHAVTLFTTSSYGVSREPATFFSQVHTFQTRLSHTFPCFLLANCLVFAGTCCRCQAADTQNSVAEEDGLNTGRTWTGGGKRRHRGEPHSVLHGTLDHEKGASRVGFLIQLQERMGTS